MESPEYFYDGIYRTGTSQLQPEKRHSDLKTTAGECFHIEDLLDFSNEEIAGNVDNTTGNSTDSSTVTVVETAGSCNSPFSGDGVGCQNYNYPHFPCEVPVQGCRNNSIDNYTGELAGQSYSDPHDPGDLCVPLDDLAELEWLSNFVEESFSSEDLQKLHLINGTKARENAPENHEFTGVNDFSGNSRNANLLPELSTIRSKARSKRSRAAPCNWSSRILVLSQTNSRESDVFSDSGKAPAKTTKKREISDVADNRKCLHCATDKTPQWRTGPMGPKTLCNACGVRYKSGRLVPEYRPAASPTFVLTKHSNSHRKVMELRRQKEVHNAQQQFLHQASIFEVAADDFLIHAGPDFRQLI